MVRRANSNGTSPLLAVVAVLLVAGFLYWLSLQARGVEQEVRPEPQDSGELVDFVPAQLVEAPETLVGEVGALRDVGVSQSLGRGVLTVDLDGENSYPVLLGPDIIARGTTVRSGDRVTVYGRIFSLNDSIRAAWVEGDAVEAGNARAIPATSSFVLADSLTFN